MLPVSSESCCIFHLFFLSQVELGSLSFDQNPDSLDNVIKFEFLAVLLLSRLKLSLFIIYLLFIVFIRLELGMPENTVSQPFSLSPPLKKKINYFQ